MKRRFLLLLLCALLIVSTLVVPCFATVPRGPEKVVYDRADLLSDANERALNDAVRDVWSMTESCSFYVATHELTYRYAPYYTGDDFLDDHNLSSSNNLVLLVITLDQGTYYYNMYTYGNATNRIRDREVDFILDHDDVYPNIKSGKLLEGASAFMSLAVKAYGGRIAGASYVTVALVSFVIALIIGVAACIGVKSAYSMKKKSVDYPLSQFAKLELKEHSDVFTGSFITKRIINTDSGGRSGGGGGRGGGGGHRGGR